MGRWNNATKWREDEQSRQEGAGSSGAREGVASGREGGQRKLELALAPEIDVGSGRDRGQDAGER